MEIKYADASQWKAAKAEAEGEKKLIIDIGTDSKCNTETVISLIVEIDSAT